MNMQASWELEVAEDQLGNTLRREVLRVLSVSLPK
jgi:hypothetical protein